MLNHNLNITGKRFELQAYADLISTADAFKLSRLSELLIMNLNDNFGVIQKKRILISIKKVTHTFVC
jgi:hypothetical protein